MRSGRSTPDEVISKIAEYEGILDRLSLSGANGPTLEDTRSQTHLLVELFNEYRVRQSRAAS